MNKFMGGPMPGLSLYWPSLAEMWQALPLKPTTLSKNVLAQVPPPFDSHNKAKWETFHNTLTAYVAAYELDFDSDRKIFFTLSLLWKGDGTVCPVSNWVQNWKH